MKRDSPSTKFAIEGNMDTERKRDVSCYLMSVAEVRLRKEYREMQERRYPHASFRTDLSPPFQDHFTLYLPLTLTPAVGPFAHQSFALMICIPAGFPYAAPWVIMRNSNSHPDVDSATGVMRLRVVAPDVWNKDITLHNVLFEVQQRILCPQSEGECRNNSSEDCQSLDFRSVSPPFSPSLKRRIDPQPQVDAKRPKLQH